VCVCVCLCVCAMCGMCVCAFAPCGVRVFMCMCINNWTSARISLFTMSVCVSVKMCVYGYACGVFLVIHNAFAYPCACMHVWVRACMCVCV
jgi:hypothetical protein